MAQGDYLIENQSFPTFRSDLNSTLEAINTSNSGTSRPSSAVAGTIWLDTTSATTPTLKFYDGSDDISLATLDYTANTVNWLDSTVVFDIVGDTTPQLGGDLDVNGNSLVSTSNGNITFTPNGSGKVVVSGLSYPTADGSADQVLKTDGAGNLSFGDVSAGMYKNIIINGDMSLSQRSTSETGITASSYNTLDRFKLTIGSAGTWTQSQSTDVPSGQGFAKSLKMDCTTANASLSSGAYFFLEQQIEGQNLQYLKKGTANAESLTLSFWVKSNKTGTYIAELRDTDNDRAISKSYTISSASTWEKKTITFAGDTSGAFTNDNNTSLRLEFHLGAGSSYQSGTLQTSWGARTQADEVVGQVNLADSTSNEWYITGVQLEAGQTATEFDFLPNDINKNRCYRYFQKLSVVLMNFNATGLLGFVFPVEMRANPSVSREYSGTANRMYNVGTAATADVVSPTTIVSNKTIRYWYAFSPASWATATRSGWETEYTLDSEL